MSTINLKPINRRTMTIRIVEETPLIQHQWDEKAKRQMREKHAGKKTKNRDVRNPEAEFEAATYRTASGEFGIPASAIKKALITAAHKDLGIEKTLVRKAIFLRCDDPGNVLRMDCKERLMREDVVRVGMGSTDLRYRPEFRGWSVEIEVEYDNDLMGVGDIVALFDRAGFGVGIGESRPEKDGENGRFRVDAETGVTVMGKAA